MEAGAGNDTVSGNDGNDTIYGQDGDDTLNGNLGDDYLNAGEGNNTVSGDEGADTIYSGSGVDTLSGGAGNDYINAGSGDDIVDGNLGNDTLNGQYGNDTLIGGEGNDILFGDYEYTSSTYTVGSDTLTGGAGNDTLKGGGGNDTYIFNRGDGVDNIYDNYAYVSYYGTYWRDAGNDTLQFGEGITNSDVAFFMDGNNLTIAYGDGDKVTVTNHSYDGAYFRMEKFELADGAYMTYLDIERVIQDAIIYADENGIALNSVEDIRNNSALMNIMSTFWRDGIATQEYTAPIVLDLNKDGITSVSLDDSHVYFDYAADGLKEHTAWIQKGDALLVKDINNDGIINDGGELFGNYTKLADGTMATDGYAALAQYDANSDGIIDKSDAAYSEIKLFKDTNMNGKTDEGELIDLNLAGVTAIHLNRLDGSIFVQIQEDGNIITNETVYNSGNIEGAVRDVWFKYDDQDTITDNDTLYGTTEVDKLSGGDGNDTYVIASGGLQDIIDDNGTGADVLKFTDGITKERIIAKWVRGTDDILLAIKANAEDDASINELENSILIKNWFNDSGLIENIEFSDGETLNREQIYALLSGNGIEDITLRSLDVGSDVTGNIGNDVLYGSLGNETLDAKEGNDYLKGLEGDDYLIGGDGDDTLVGGSGDDTLVGGDDNDFYIFNKGDGKDTILDGSGVDTIMFGDGIDRRDVIINYNGEDVVMTFAYDDGSALEDSDTITIKNMAIDGFEIEELLFSNGDSFSISELIEKNTNHAPTTLFSESAYTLTDVSLQTGIVLARDIDGDTLNYTVSTLPENGTLSINKYGIWTYASNDKYKGLDSAVITIDDGNGLSTTKTLNFEVVITNVDPIVLEAQTDVILQDIREATGDVGATDEDGDILTYSITTAALHGTVNVDETGTWIYSVEGTYIGTDSAVITVDDGQGGSVTKTLNFDAKVSAPSIDTVAFNLLEDNISTNNLNVYNPVGGALTYEIIATSENGTFTLDENGEYSYNPSQNYNGLDAVIVKVTNEYGLSTTSTLTFDIEAVNDAPVTTETEAFILQDVREQAGEVEATDVDGDVLTFSVTTAAQHGTLSIDETGAWTYSVDGYYMGEDSAVITVDDGNGGTATKTLTFDARVTTPSLADATANLLEDNPSNGIFNVVNPIGGVLTYEVLTATANGDFTVDADGNWNYNSSQDYNGSDAIIVKVTNEYGLSTTSTLSFEIEAVNDAPIVALESEAFTLINIRDIDGKIEASDVDGDTLTYTVDTQAANGIVTVDSEGNWHYKADGSFNGTDSATILINDGAGGTVTSRLDFTVEGYIYEGGDLVITDNGDDTLVMDNLDKSDLAFTRNGDNLNIAVKDQGSVTLTDYFINIQSGVQKITTAQGDISLDKDVIKSADVFIWRGSADGDSNVKNLLIGSSYNNSLDGNNLDDILFGGSNYDSLKGFGGNDTLVGGDNSDNLYGGDGHDNLWGDEENDFLYGENGNDNLFGGLGNDFLSGGIDDDFLSGGTGSDRLEGGGSNDTYFFKKYDQDSTINDYDGIGRFHSKDAGYDTIKFDDGINKNDVSFIMDRGNLYIQYGDTDTIKVNNQNNIYNKIEKLEFADGSFLTNDDIDIVIQQLNAYASDKGMWTYNNETVRNNTEMMGIVSSAWRA